jgi:hypothetical protein
MLFFYVGRKMETFSTATDTFGIVYPTGVDINKKHGFFIMALSRGGS